MVLMALPNKNPTITAVKRVRILYALLLCIVGLYGVRLFYLQIIRYSHYKAAALQQQFESYQIPAERGLIEAHDGSQILPLVLNQNLYTLYADPKFIKDPYTDAKLVANIIGGNETNYEQAMRQPNRYDILAKKISEDQKNKILAAKQPGLNAVAQTYRVYPNGSLASQLLGFVNDSGQGTYGIEQVLNHQLSGKPGLLKAVTDVHGVPLPADSNNVQISPQAGKNVILTIDMAIQSHVEDLLQQGLKNANSKAGSAIVMNVHTGAIVAMANYPTYDPTNYATVNDPTVFNNPSVGSQLEVGSVMKVLTTSAALDQGVITPNTVYPDSGAVTVDGFTIRNVEPIPGGMASIQDVLRLSLNTGAVHMLTEMGGGQINSKGRNIWHDYLVNHYHFGKPTGIEQSYEASGFVPDPNGGSAPDLRYAETAFGQGISVTMLQLVSALSSVLNGGTYYQPHLVDGYIDSAGNIENKPLKIVSSNVVKPQVPAEIEQLMEGVFNSNYGIYRSHLHAGYNIGGKTGTAQIPINGGYDPNFYNGTFLGFIGGDQPQYAVVILTKAPVLAGYEYAGTEGAAPIFGSIADMLIDSGKVIPRTH